MNLVRSLTQFTPASWDTQTVANFWHAIVNLVRMNVSASNTMERITSILVLFFAMAGGSNGALGAYRLPGCRLLTPAFLSDSRGGLLLHCWSHHCAPALVYLVIPTGFLLFGWLSGWVSELNPPKASRLRRSRVWRILRHPCLICRAYEQSSQPERVTGL